MKLTAKTTRRQAADRFPALLGSGFAGAKNKSHWLCLFIAFIFAPANLNAAVGGAEIDPQLCGLCELCG
jgi:hypothetical protein